LNAEAKFKVSKRGNNRADRARGKSLAAVIKPKLPQQSLASCGKTKLPR